MNAWKRISDSQLLENIQKSYNERMERLRNYSKKTRKERLEERDTYREQDAIDDVLYMEELSVRAVYEVCRNLAYRQEIGAFRSIRDNDEDIRDLRKEVEELRKELKELKDSRN